MKKPYSFDLTVNTTARFTIPAADYEKVLVEFKEALEEIKNDTEGKAWGEAVRTGDEALYHLLNNAMQEAEGDVKAAAELVLYSVIRQGITQAVNDSFNEDGVNKLQTVVKIVSRGDSNTKEQAE